jgi:hypothetical protein
MQYTFVGVHLTAASQMVENNKADCMKIAERVNRLTEELIESIGGQEEASLDPHLKRDLDRFEKLDLSWYCHSTQLHSSNEPSRDLKEILQVLEAIANPKLTTRVWKYKENSDALVDCHRTLDHSLQRFVVCPMCAEYHKQSPDHALIMSGL